MDKHVFDMQHTDIAWCPGCGNFHILDVVKQALAELDIPPQQLVMVSGIGQAAKTPHYLRCNVFNGLHGRALPAASAIKVANPSLTVIAESGDGCMYGEGGNHFLHAIRRNPDITVLVHNNMVYGLTKGQASPTSRYGFKTPVQVQGVILEPFNPLAVAISLDASFVARAYAADREQTKTIMKAAIQHHGFSLVDIFQFCVSYNKVNTHHWFKENTYYLPEDHDPENREQALHKALDEEKLCLGIVYRNRRKASFEDSIGFHDKSPMYTRKPDPGKLADLIESKRS